MSINALHKGDDDDDDNDDDDDDDDNNNNNSSLLRSAIAFLFIHLVLVYLMTVPS